MTKFYRATLALVMRKARTLLRAREDAEEVANDVNLCVCRHLLDYELSSGSAQAGVDLFLRAPH